MRPLAITLAVLSLLTLAAHFLRSSNLFFVIVCVVLIGFFWVRAGWARRTLQIALAFGALEWLRVAMDIGEMRQLHGEPWVRMAVILGSVALVAGLAALALESRQMKVHFGAAQPVTRRSP